MGLVPKIKIGDWLSVRQAIRRLALKLGPTSIPTIASITLTDLTASRLVATNASKKLVSTDLNAWVTETANRVLVSTDSNGGIILTAPQDLHTSATITFGVVTSQKFRGSTFGSAAVPVFTWEGRVDTGIYSSADHLIDFTTDSGRRLSIGNGGTTLYAALVGGANTISGTAFDINGGTIDGTTIGASSATTGIFTTVTAMSAVIQNQVKAGNETAGDPSYTFSGDPDTGMYRYGANEIGFACNGANAARITATNLVHVGIVQGDFLFAATGIYASDDAGSPTANYITLGDDAIPGVALFGVPDNHFDLGKGDREWKDLYIDGKAYIDALGHALDCGGFALSNVGAITSIGLLTLTPSASQTPAIFIEGRTNDFSTSGTDVYTAQIYRDIDYGNGNNIGNIFGIWNELSHKTITGNLPGDRAIRGFVNAVNNTGTISNPSGDGRYLYWYPFQLVVADTGTYDSAGAGFIYCGNNGQYIVLNLDPTFTDTSGGGVTNFLVTSGIHIENVITPTLSSGNLVAINHGVRVNLVGNAAGSSTNYGVKIDAVTGADVNWAFYDTSGAASYFEGPIYFGQIDGAEKIVSDGNNSLDLYSGGSINMHDDVELTNAEFLVFDKASGNGIKVDTATPTFGWADLLGEPTVKNTGGSRPALIAYRDGLLQFEFAAGEEEYFQFHIPHDYVKGTDIFLHYHWSTNGALVNGGTVTFDYEISYSKGHGQTAFPASVSGTVVSATASSTQYTHELTEVQISASTPSGSQIDTDDLEPDGIILATLGLNANNLTVSSGGVPDPFIHYIDIHYQTTGLIGTKDKAPDFYA